MQKNEQIQLIFALKVKYYRMLKGLSYKKLSEISGLSVSYLNDIERGKKYPKHDKINSLSNALGISYNSLVSTEAPQQIAPILELFFSDFMTLMTSESLYIDPYDLLNLLTTAPEKMNTLIMTLFNISTSYHLKSKDLFLTAMLSYQAMHDNYFEELELAAKDFLKEINHEKDQPLLQSHLIEAYASKVGFDIDKETLSNNPTLRHLHSHQSEESKTLYINSKLNAAQKKFILGRELGFSYLEIKERAHSFPMTKVDNFDDVFNNHKASYFSNALMLPKDELTAELKKVGELTEWNPASWLQLINHFSVTPEMLLTRICNLLIDKFDIKKFFFTRIEQSIENPNKFNLKNALYLNLSYNSQINVKDEKFCRRWLSLNSLLQPSKATFEIKCQITNFIRIKSSYFCISFNQFNHLGIKESVTLGILINEASLKHFRFLGDPSIPRIDVGLTCERCDIQDCMVRANAPIALEKNAKKLNIEKALEAL